MTTNGDVLDWLLDGDPAIRWQVKRDLVGASASTVERERSRALDFFREVNAPRDARLTEAIDILRARRGADGRWSLENRYQGKTFFEMERVGQASRWNTLRALRVLEWWDARRH